MTGGALDLTVCLLLFFFLTKNTNIIVLPDIVNCPLLSCRRFTTVFSFHNEPHRLCQGSSRAA